MVSASSRGQDRYWPPLFLPPTIPTPTISFTGSGIRRSSSTRCALRKPRDLRQQTAVERLREFVDFNRSLRELDGRELIRHARFRKEVQPSFLQYVRPDDEMAAVFGGAVLGEARVNPDGTLDFTRWARPQNDGPALQVLTLTRWRNAQPGPG